jgi:hypothetical protein
MDRETREITTPIDNHKVVIKTYLNVGELRIVEGVFLSKIKIDADGIAQQDYDGSLLNVAQDKLIENAIVSVDLKTENILQEVLAFKKPDFDFLIEELGKVKTGDVDQKKN